MKLINQSFEIIQQEDFTLRGIKKFIERCARVCYKSEDQITDTSYDKFVDMLISKDHSRCLEFGTVHLKLSISDFHDLRNILGINKIWNNQWVGYIYVGDKTYITTNYRYFLDIIKIYPEIGDFFTEEDNNYFPKRYTVHFILNRAIMDEFRTHVGLSHLAESSRYCNYSKGKFNNELTFIKPSWYNGAINPEDQTLKDPKSEIFTVNCMDAEEVYLDMIKHEATPQQAREVLPLSIKSELISCGFKDAWQNFFYRRCAPSAHPMAREIAIPLKEKFTTLT